MVHVTEYSFSSSLGKGRFFLSLLFVRFRLAEGSLQKKEANCEVVVL